jgi:hypothetical protein
MGQDGSYVMKPTSDGARLGPNLPGPPPRAFLSMNIYHSSLTREIWMMIHCVLR